jgi:hypothetical protein
MPNSEFFHVDERRIPATPDSPTDYGTFTTIAEVMFECVNPNLQRVNGIQPHDSVTEPHLGSLGWFVDGIENLWSEFKRLNIRGLDLARREPEGDGPPLDTSGTPIIFTLASETGVSYEFLPYRLTLDPLRGVPDVSPSDPLGIERCSHHTVLTNQLDRALRLLVGILGGRIIHEGRNDVLATQSTYLALADGVLELGEPLDSDSPAMEDWLTRAPDDTHYSLTWQVRDLDQVADHLKACGIRLRARTDSIILTDSGDTIGISWGFTTARIPGDPR